MTKSKLIGRGLIRVVILVLLATIVYDQIKLHREPTQYHLDIQTEDMALKDRIKPFSITTADSYKAYEVIPRVTTKPAD